MFNRNYVLCVWGGFTVTALVLLALFIIGTGCGAYEGDDIGDVEQDLSVKIQPHYIHGINRLSSNALCQGVPGGGSEECYVPYKGSQSICFQNGTAAEKTAFRFALGRVVSASNNRFIWTEPDINGCSVTTDWTINFSFPCGASGGGSNGVQDFVCVNQTQSAAGSFIGTANGGLTKFYAFHSPVAGVAHVDSTDINARKASLTAAQKTQFENHLYGNLAMQMVGRGNRGDALSNNKATGRFVTPFATRDIGTAGDLCALQSYSFANPGTFATSGFCATD